MDPAGDYEVIDFGTLLLNKGTAVQHRGRWLETESREAREGREQEGGSEDTTAAALGLEHRDNGAAVC